MERLKYFIKAFVIISLFIATTIAHAQTLDYLIKFKVPVQQTFCISKAPNGDMDTYKKCMLAIEKGAYKCDKETKPAYDNVFIKHIDNGGVTEYMDELKPIIEKHFMCLNTLY